MLLFLASGGTDAQYNKSDFNYYVGALRLQAMDPSFCPEVMVPLSIPSWV